MKYACVIGVMLAVAVFATAEWTRIDDVKSQGLDAVLQAVSEAARVYEAPIESRVEFTLLDQPRAARVINAVQAAIDAEVPELTADPDIAGILDELETTLLYKLEYRAY